MSEIESLPAIQALRPLRAPYLDRLSDHSDLLVWHIDVEFDEFPIPDDVAARWADRDTFVAETWQKRPLAVGTDSACSYSCGEVELAARLRNAGFEAYWISEWAGFKHVECWAPFCVKRTEFRDRAPMLWEYDQSLRATSAGAQEILGTRGGHPDIGCLTPDGNVYFEYKGPRDSIKSKQNSWAAAVVDREQPRIAYVAVRGMFRPAAHRKVSLMHAPRPQAVTREQPLPLTSDVSGDHSDRSSNPVASRPKKSEKLHRRTISDTLKRERQWQVTSKVDGSIDFTVPGSAKSIDSFVDEVRKAVEELGYTPTVRIARSGGHSVVRVHTAETLAQAPRGAHGV